jgi:uncharacterized membrane protein
MEISHIRDQLSREHSSGLVRRALGASNARPQDNFSSSASRDGGPHATPAKALHPFLIGPGAALFIGAFVTDLIYRRTLLVQWGNFSVWLITAGLIMAALSALAFLLDLARGRIGKIAWWRFAGLAGAAVLSLLNVFVHSRDAYTGVVPLGIALSAIVTVLLIATSRRGWNLSAPAASSQTKDAF